MTVHLPHSKHMHKNTNYMEQKIMNTHPDTTLHYIILTCIPDPQWSSPSWLSLLWPQMCGKSFLASTLLTLCPAYHHTHTRRCICTRTHTHTQFSMWVIVNLCMSLQYIYIYDNLSLFHSFQAVDVIAWEPWGCLTRRVHCWQTKAVKQWEYFWPYEKISRLLVSLPKMWLCLTGKSLAQCVCVITAHIPLRTELYQLSSHLQPLSCTCIWRRESWHQSQMHTHIKQNRVLCVATEKNSALSTCL